MDQPELQALIKYLHGYPADLGLFLAHRLAQWFRERPHLRLRCVVPIQRDGYTVELHGWYEQTLFPDLGLRRFLAAQAARFAQLFRVWTIPLSWS